MKKSHWIGRSEKVEKMIEDCTLIRLAKIYPLRLPEVVEGRCEGYYDQNDKPHNKCKKCKASIYCRDDAKGE